MTETQTHPDPVSASPWQVYLARVMAVVEALALSYHDGLPCWCRRDGQGGGPHTKACSDVRVIFAERRR